MKKILLLCATLGLAYGSSVEVGNEPGQIKEEDALDLIAEGNAREINEKPDGSNELLKKQAKEKDALIDDLTKKLEEATKYAKEKDALIDDLTKKLEALEKAPKK